MKSRARTWWTALLALPFACLSLGGCDGDLEDAAEDVGDKVEDAVDK